MGIVPIWGFQLVTAIALSIFFRLNKALVIVAANISIPPMIPVIVYLSHYTGKLWMGKNAQSITFSDKITLQFIHNNALQYFSGAITLSVVAGIVFGMVTYLMLKVFKKRQSA
ncbi:MAG TPA: DUF2062 domain-containing protein [Chryseosolibacter sp.]